MSFGRAFAATLRNRSFVVYLTATVLALLAQNMLMGALPYFVTVVMGGAKTEVGYLMAESLAVAGLALLRRAFQPRSDPSAVIFSSWGGFACRPTPGTAPRGG